MSEPTQYVPLVLCAIHQRPLVAPTMPAFCPLCRASRGGGKRTPKQQAHSKVLHKGRKR